MTRPHERPAVPLWAAVAMIGAAVGFVLWPRLVDAGAAVLAVLRGR